jgi:hypothetical protein
MSTRRSVRAANALFGIRDSRSSPGNSPRRPMTCQHGQGAPWQKPAKRSEDGQGGQGFPPALSEVPTWPPHLGGGYRDYVARWHCHSFATRKLLLIHKLRLLSNSATVALLLGTVTPAAHGNAKFKAICGPVLPRAACRCLPAAREPESRRGGRSGVHRHAGWSRGRRLLRRGSGRRRCPSRDRRRKC